MQKIKFELFKSGKPKHFLRPLLAICQIFALVVPNLHKMKPPSVFYIGYTKFVVAFLLVIMVGSTYQKVTHFYSISRTTTAILDVFISIGITFINILTILTSSMKHGMYLQFVNQINVFDKSYNIKYGFISKKAYKMFLLELLTLHIGVFLYIIFDAALFISLFGEVAYAYHWTFCLNMYMFALNIFLIYNFAIALKHRYFIINKRLLNYHQKLKTDIKNPGNIYESIKSMKKDHSSISDMVDLMNEIFGFQLLCTLCFFIVYIIQSLNLALSISQSDVNIYMILVNLWNASEFIVSNIFIYSFLI